MTAMEKSANRSGKRAAARMRAIRRKAAAWQRRARRAVAIALIAASIAEAPTRLAPAQIGQLGGAGGAAGVGQGAMGSVGGLVNGAVQRLVQPRQRAQLTRILTYHVVPGRISAADLTTAVRVGGGSATLETVEGGRLVAQDAGRGHLRIVDSTGETFLITATDVNASNGVIHVIDGVLTPGH
jgi:hypothetical protein